MSEHQHRVQQHQSTTSSGSVNNGIREHDSIRARTEESREQRTIREHHHSTQTTAPESRVHRQSREQHQGGDSCGSGAWEDVESPKHEWRVPAEMEEAADYYSVDTPKLLNTDM